MCCPPSVKPSSRNRRYPPAAGWVEVVARPQAVRTATARIRSAIRRRLIVTPPTSIQAGGRFGSGLVPGQALAEVGDGLDEARIERGARLPLEELAGAGGVGAGLFRVVFGQGAVDDLTRAAPHVPDWRRGLDHRDLIR